MTIAEARAQFPVLERYAYLNAGTNGPLARPTVEAMIAQNRADLETGRGGAEYFARTSELRERVRGKLAAAVDVPEENLSLSTSTTNGCNIVLAGLGLGPEDEIVTTDGEHFGLLGALPPDPDLVGGTAEERVRRTVVDLETAGLELLADGEPLDLAAPPEPAAVVDGWRRATAATSQPVKQVLAGP